MPSTQRWTKKTWIALLAGASLAALAGPARSAEPAQGIAVRFLPGDRFTSVGGSPLGLLVGDGSAPLDRKSLVTLAAGLSLETYPEGRPVPGRTEIQGLANGSERARVDFLPAAALGDGWYRLRAVLPAPYVAAGDARPAGDGRWGVRFRSGAQMVVRSLRACREGDGLRLDLALSERAASTSWPAAVGVTQGRAALACLPIVPPAPAGESKRGDLGAAEISFRCSPSAAGEPIDVEIRRGLVSLGGLAAGGPEETLAYRLAAPSLWPDACLALSPAGRGAAGAPRPTDRTFDSGREVGR